MPGKMRAADLYCGAGGTSEGARQSGAAEVVFALQMAVEQPRALHAFGNDPFDAVGVHLDAWQARLDEREAELRRRELEIRQRELDRQFPGERITVDFPRDRASDIRLARPRERDHEVATR